MIIQYKKNGSNSNGNYIKYTNGLMICYASKSLTLDITGAFEGEYFEATGDINFPSNFANAPIVTVSLVQNNALLKYNHVNIYTNKFTGYISKLQSKSNVTVTIEYIAIGQWQ